MTENPSGTAENGCAIAIRPASSRTRWRSAANSARVIATTRSPAPNRPPSSRAVGARPVSANSVYTASRRSSRSMPTSSQTGRGAPHRTHPAGAAACGSAVPFRLRASSTWLGVVTVGWFSRLLTLLQGGSGRPARSAALGGSAAGGRKRPKLRRPGDQSMTRIERSVTTTRLPSGKKQRRTTSEWRHGNCPVRHRSHEAAARCRRS